MRHPHLHLHRPRRFTTIEIMILSALVALALALGSICTFSLSPPGIHKRSLEVAVASSHVMLEAPRSWTLDQSAGVQDFQNLGRRADLFANVLTSSPERDKIGAALGLPAGSVAGVTRLTGNVTNALLQPNSEERATQIFLSERRYRIDVQTTPERPIINISAQAPSLAEATHLADASAAELVTLVGEMVEHRNIKAKWQVQAQVIGGAARGTIVSGSTVPQIFILTFLVAFAASCALLLGLRRLARPPTPASESPASTSPSGSARVADVARDVGRRVVGKPDDWPRTTRILPWMVAGFLVIIWLVPFNKIQLTASLPFDLKFDRLVLPLLFGVWILSLAAGGREAPRVRGTWIHVGIGGFVLAACLSVVFDAHYLNQTLEFDLSVKKLVLLFSYALLFILIASSIRRSEVPAFFRLTLALALVCAAGTIYEYRFHYNIFYQAASHLLPGFFTVGQAESGDVDIFGRQLTFGPSEHPLELVGMLTMALPIALVGLMHAAERRGRILYGLATCVILAATIATYRKSALLAPVSVGLTLAYFRRSQLLRLAPLALPALVLVHLLSPGAFGSIVEQGSHLGVGTVSDRAADYDAVRPDVWTHLWFGRGYGSYDHVSYRILDSEALNRVVDTGVVGIVAYLLMLGSILFCARPLIRDRDNPLAKLALAVSAATVAFLTLSFLFDVTSFPHTPYILMSLAGFLAVMRLPAPEDEPAPEGERQPTVPYDHEAETTPSWLPAPSGPREPAAV